MIIIDDKYKKIDKFVRGRKAKMWFLKDDQEYLFKYGASNYEIYAELIAEQLGLNCNIDMAHYELAKYQNYIGVLTPNFLEKHEFIISSDNLKKTVQLLYQENNIKGDLRDNTILNLVQSMFTYDPNIDTEKITYELMKRWLFTGLIMESDKNATNIGIIKSSNGLSLAPDYDNSTMARLNENVDNFVDNIHNDSDIYNLIDTIKLSLKLTADESDNFLETFDLFVKKYPNQAKMIMDEFRNIDVEMAIKIVETTNDIEIPWIIKYWIEKVIDLRHKDMTSIMNNNLGKSYIR